MARYELIYLPSVVKDLRSFPKTDVRRILARSEKLRSDPFPPGFAKLAGNEGRYRVRQGDYRILYTVNEGRVVVTVIKIAHRSHVYKN
jgi:mRNA interferase RelE/StbE